MPDKIEWLPILMALGEKTVSRIIERSPDLQSAVLQAKEEFDKAEDEARALRQKGHEGE